MWLNSGSRQDGRNQLRERKMKAVGSRRHRRFTEKDTELIMRIIQYHKQGFVLRVAVEKGKRRIMKK